MQGKMGVKKTSTVAGIMGNSKTGEALSLPLRNSLSGRGVEIWLREKSKSNQLSKQHTEVG